MENNKEINIQVIENPNDDTNEVSAGQRKIEADKTKKRAIGWAIASGALALATTAAVIVAAPYLAGAVSSLASWSWSTVSGVIWGWEVSVPIFGEIAVGPAIGISLLTSLFAPIVGAVTCASSWNQDSGKAGFWLGAAVGGIIAICGAVLGIGLGIASLGCFLAPALPFIAGLGALTTIGIFAYKSISNFNEAKKILKGEPEEPEQVKLEKSNEGKSIEQEKSLDEKANQKQTEENNNTNEVGGKNKSETGQLENTHKPPLGKLPDEYTIGS